jgi:hypothetical protein
MIINWITVHFGKNPMNGGRSPNDSSVVNRICFTVLLLFTVVA